jgi:preprotein translocase subunit SecA
VPTSRLTFIYNAARLIENRDPDEIAEDVLSHLQDAQTAIRYEWGRNELGRLADVRPVDLDEDVCAGLERQLSEATFTEIKSQPFNQLDPAYREAVIHELGRQAMTKIYRQLLLSVISNLWVEYLTQVEALRVSIGLEAYAQRDPLVQYKNRAFEMFQDLLRDMRLSVVSRMFTFRARDHSVVTATIDREVVPVAESQTPAQKEKTTTKKKRRRRRRRKR